MYLWKYWRESRITFAVGMALVGLMLWGVLKIPVGSLLQSNQNNGPVNPAQLYLVVAAVLTFPLAFLALLFGSFGVGRDLGQGSGSFVFSRPRSRAFFVWSDWGYGLAQLLLIVLAANLVLALAIRRAAFDSGPILLAGEPVPMASVFLLHCASGLLLIGLMFGLTYFTSVLVKGRGVLLAIGVILVYLIAKSVVKYKWPSITLPDLTLTEFTMIPTGGASFADHLGLEIALRSAVALAFPVAAQLLLQQRDVD
jgi:ABC-type transport system involved in multi-copper enzyme maturation permease subunit